MTDADLSNKIGIAETRLKSFKVKPKPILIMMINKARGNLIAVKKFDSIDYLIVVNYRYDPRCNFCRVTVDASILRLQTS